MFQGYPQDSLNGPPLSMASSIANFMVTLTLNKSILSLKKQARIYTCVISTFLNFFFHFLASIQDFFKYFFLSDPPSFFHFLLSKSCNTSSSSQEILAFLLSGPTRSLNLENFAVLEDSGESLLMLSLSLKLPSWLGEIIVHDKYGCQFWKTLENHFQCFP